MPSMTINLSLVEALLLKMYQIKVMFPMNTSYNFINALTHDSVKVKALGGISLTFDLAQNQSMPPLHACLLTEEDMRNFRELDTFEELKELSQADKGLLLKSLIGVELILLAQVLLATCIKDIPEKDLITAIKMAKKRNIMPLFTPFISFEEEAKPSINHESKDLEDDIEDDIQALSEDNASKDNLSDDDSEMDVQNQFCCYRLYQKLKTNFSYYFPVLSNAPPSRAKPKYQ